MSAQSSPNLTYLLPTTPYTLAYSLPLLCLSFLLTFTGTFLMLDRSRSFPPSTDYSALPGAFEKNRKYKLVWFLEGGAGGLACGYTTGLHLATFLSLVIPTNTSSTSLSPKSFLVVWVLVCVVTTLLSGRYRYAALTTAGLSGGQVLALASLALSVIIHPSLAPRVALTAILSPLLTFLVLLFYFVPKFHSWLLHPTLRFCTSSNGAFGVVLSISLLLNPRVDGWANVWERLWLHDGDGWGTGKEKGLSAAFCIFLVVGAAADWALRRWLGECPDEKWDKYLANYMTNLPNQADRAGIFEPPRPFWDRFFSSKEDKRDPILLPSDSDLKATPQSPLKLSEDSRSSPVTFSDGLLKKSRTQSHKNRFHPQTARKRKPIKFGVYDDLSSSDEDGDIGGSPIPLPPLSYSSSTPTLVEELPKSSRKKSTALLDNPAKPLVIDYDAELAELKKRKGNNLEDLQDYSDHEEDLTSVSQRRQSISDDHQGPWRPPFMDRHSTGLNVEPASSAGPVMPGPVLGSIPVPATPSLIKAFDRIAMAQREAFRHGSTSPALASTPASDSGLKTKDAGPNKQESDPKTVKSPRGQQRMEEEEDNVKAVENARRERAPRWEEFWREVRVKAHS
ncbi:hypothetical protein AN958_01789 [Leucoagaricus sp. SymC.cos]|nr:hypothetical protein AN958_01789 [Leucoagaricus sp. SymC.cos]